MVNGELTLDKLEDEEIWKVKLSTGGEYELSKLQATILQQEIASGNRGIILFKTFSISIPYISEFYLARIIGHQKRPELPATAAEEEYVPIPEGKWKEIRKKMHETIGKHYFKPEIGT